MKLNKIILVSIFLLAILSLTPLCASEDVADDGSFVIGDPEDEGVDEGDDFDADLDEDIDEGDDFDVDPDEDMDEENPDEGADEVNPDSGSEDENMPNVTVNYPERMAQGSNKFFEITLPSNFTGTLEVDAGEGPEIIAYENSKAKVSLKNLDYGEQTIFVSAYDDDYYSAYDAAYDLMVYRVLNLKVSCPGEIYLNNPTKVTFTGPDDLWGYMRVTVDGKTYSGEFEEGKAVVTITAKSLGTKTISYVYDDMDEEEIYGNGTFTAKVVKKPTIKASNMALFSTQSKTYSVKLLDGNGKAVKNAKITVYLDGVKYKDIKTDSKGVAKLAIGKRSSGTYRVKMTYNGVSVTKTLKVKSVLGNFKKATVKNAKKLTVQIKTNKVNGKYYKGKTVTFKYNNKKFYAKINSKGIAKVSIPKSVFAKCKTGNDYFYYIQASFGKDVKNVFITFSKVKPKLSYKLSPAVAGVGGA